MIGLAVFGQKIDKPFLLYVVMVIILDAGSQ